MPVGKVNGKKERALNRTFLALSTWGKKLRIVQSHHRLDNESEHWITTILDPMQGEREPGFFFWWGECPLLCLLLFLPWLFIPDSRTPLLGTQSRSNTAKNKRAFAAATLLVYQLLLPILINQGLWRFTRTSILASVIKIQDLYLVHPPFLRGGIFVRGASSHLLNGKGYV